MNILFLRFFPLLDGSLTLKMRLAEKLNELGHNTYFLFTCPIHPELEKEVIKVSPVLYPDDLKRRKDNGDLPSIDVIHAGAAGDDIYKSYDIKSAYFPDAAIVFCAWATNTFIHTSKLGFSPDGLFYKSFFKLLPEQNIAFTGNGVILKKHKAFFKRTFGRSHFVSNALKIPPTRQERKNINKRKLVTITRLAPAKEYVLATVDVIKELKDQGYNYEFHIYGDGPFFSDLKNKVEKDGLEEHVFLYGELAYSKVSETLMDAGYFIGMGGSIIEAAALAVPSIQAIEYHPEPTAYGWFHDFSDGEVGEYDRERKKIKVFELLANVYEIDQDTYDKMSEKSYQSAKDFSIEKVIERYLVFIQGADRRFNFYFPKWKRWLLKLARQPFKLVQLSPMEVIRS